MSSEGWATQDARPLDGDPLPADGTCEADEWYRGIDALYRKNADQLIGHFASRSADRETARDVVHEAFARFTSMSLARRLTVLRPDAYLYRTCVNLLRDRNRAEGLRELHGAREAFDASSYNPLAQLEQRDALRRLEAVMLRLKPKTREIFLAKRLDGMSYAEIAERTGLSVKGVEKHMSKAIAAIDRAVERGRL